MASFSDGKLPDARGPRGNGVEHQQDHFDDGDADFEHFEMLPLAPW